MRHWGETADGNGKGADASKDGAQYHNGQARIGKDILFRETNCANCLSVHFPGAVNSKFTTSLNFDRATEEDAMPTYRIMDQDGVIVDKSRGPPDVSDEQLLKWYKDMLLGKLPRNISFIKC